MGDWLGTGRIADRNKVFLDYGKAKAFVQKLGLETTADWNKYCKSGKKPSNIPSAPHLQYDKEWRNYGDWLGTGTVAPQNREFRAFEEAREFVHTLDLPSSARWIEYSKSRNKPHDIPARPVSVYKKDWKGWGDWLGTGTIASINRHYKSFDEAKKFVHSLGLKNRDEWVDYSKSGTKPSDIPAGPGRTYKTNWKGWGDWLGTGIIATQNRKYMAFEEAREFVHALGLKNQREWRDYCYSGRKPSNIPNKPEKVCTGRVERRGRLARI